MRLEEMGVREGMQSMWEVWYGKGDGMGWICIHT